MMVIAAKLFKAAIGNYWWQIPMVVATVTSIVLWDNSRIRRHVDLGKVEVRKEISDANTKAVVLSRQVRAKAGTTKAADLDPYTKDD